MYSDFGDVIHDVRVGPKGILQDLVLSTEHVQLQDSGEPVGVCHLC